MGNNAGFHLICKNEGTYLQFNVENENDIPIDVIEVCDYLDVKRINYDKFAVMDAVKNKAKIIRIDNISRQPENEIVKITVSADHMQAVGRFYPPAVGGSLMDRTQIINDLVRSGVKYGVVEENINKFLENREYFTDIILAKATPCIQGKDAKITYHFNTDLSKKPMMNEDGTVDYHKLENISHVYCGDLLATLEPDVPGRPGITVCGGVIQPNKVIHKILKHGKKIHLSEDGLQMFSEVDGHVTLIEDKVFVSDSYEVAADVDVSTGDINYYGNVVVNGSVRTGFSVIASGDIIVNGIVEGAYLQAGGQIILKCGIQGMSKGVLKANGNIVAKFIENATVETGGFLSAEAIIQSNVSAKGDVLVAGKKGCINGGQIRSGTMISAKTAGSTMGTNMLLEVGADPVLMEEYHRIERELPVMGQEIERLNQNLLLYLKKIKNGEKLAPDKLLLVKNMTNDKKQLDEKKVQLLERLEFLQGYIDNNSFGIVKISDTVYPGCKIVIAGIVYYVRKDCVRCMFKRDGADVILTAYE